MCQPQSATRVVDLERITTGAGVGGAGLAGEVGRGRADAPCVCGHARREHEHELGQGCCFGEWGMCGCPEFDDVESLQNLGWQLAIKNDLDDPEFLWLYGAALAKSECAVLLSKALTASGMTSTKAAARLGCTPAEIKSLVTGDANPTIGQIGEVLAALGYQVRMTIAPLRGEDG